MSDVIKKGGLYDFSDPRVMGRGMWHCIHSICARATTLEKRKYACETIRGFCDDFKCGDCKGHCRAYVKANPPENVIGSVDGLFYWSVQFRNDVQARIEKEIGKKLPRYDPQIMYDIFHDGEYAVCEKDCGKNGGGQDDNKGKYTEVKASRGNGQYLQNAFGYDEVKSSATSPFQIRPRVYK